jgi:hypothetical protein
MTVEPGSPCTGALDLAAQLQLTADEADYVVVAHDRTPSVIRRPGVESEPTRRWQEASEPTDRRPRHAMGCRPSGLIHIQQVRSILLILVQ